ncbi:MAG: carboxymuconolactone decarboxylase family protein [Gammaproteobacteria bacterium]|jgi:alkylhydroperoxidase family enzyme|nr:carboxymuconolactone decarboxylase family protein [Gammaproteobacteria bacterium]
MPRIPYPDPDSLPAGDRAFLESLPQLNISRMLAGSPSMFQPMTRLFSAYLSDGLLSETVREIIILRTGHLCNSEYEVINHNRVARLIGMSEERIHALKPGGDQTLFSPEEQAVLTFVDDVVTAGGATQASFDAVAAFMSPAEMLEMTVVIGVYTMVSQICATFGIEPEEISIANTGIEDIKMTVGKFT